MPLKIYKNKKSGEVKRSLSSLPKKEWEEVLTAPNQKFLVTADPITGTSKIKDQDKILKARARNYSRDREIDENIQINLKNGMKEQVHKSFFNGSGKRRTKLDDL